MKSLLALDSGGTLGRVEAICSMAVISTIAGIYQLCQVLHKASHGRRVLSVGAQGFPIPQRRPPPQPRQAPAHLFIALLEAQHHRSSL